jgi:hypothetical protein
VRGGGGGYRSVHKRRQTKNINEYAAVGAGNNFCGLMVALYILNV